MIRTGLGLGDLATIVGISRAGLDDLARSAPDALPSHLVQCRGEAQLPGARAGRGCKGIALGAPLPHLKPLGAATLLADGALAQAK